MAVNDYRMASTITSEPLLDVVRTIASGSSVKAEQIADAFDRGIDLINWDAEQRRANLRDEEELLRLINAAAANAATKAVALALCESIVSGSETRKAASACTKPSAV